MPHSAPCPAVFLDRDGTIIEEVNYLSRPEDIRLLPAAITGLQHLQPYFPLVIITNQAAIARGYLTEAGLKDINRRLTNLLAGYDVQLSGIYYCPHHPEAGNPPYRRECYCRKPRPGLLLRAARDLNLDLNRSYMIGDKLSDIAAGINAGTHTALVRTGYGQDHEKRITSAGIQPDYIADDLLAVARWILFREYGKQLP